jgi:hypothetical protein
MISFPIFYPTKIAERNGKCKETGISGEKIVIFGKK